MPSSRWAVAALLACAATVPAAEPLRPLVLKAADLVASHASKDAIRLEPPLGPKKPIAGFTSDTFQRLLAEELASRGVRVGPGGKVAVTVDCSSTKRDEAGSIGRLQMEITARPAGDPRGLVLWTKEAWFDASVLGPLLRLADPVEQGALPELSRKIAAELARQGTAVVWVKPFSGPSAGPGYALALKALLEQESGREGKLRLSPTARLHVECAYSTEAAGDGTRIVFDGALKSSRDGKAVAAFRADALLAAKEGPGLPELWIATAETSKPAPPRGSVARPGTHPEFGIEVAVKGTPATFAEGEELPLVRLADDAVYTIRLHNGSKHDAAVMLAIDGRSVFAFHPATVKPRAFIVPAGKTVELPGWYLGEGKVAAFAVSRVDPASKDVAEPGQVGTITAVFHFAWPKGSAAPADEETKGGALQTKLGEPGKVKVNYIERVIGKPRAAATIRYMAR